jgi:hypothetical protein
MGPTMIEAERNEIRLHLALLERANVLFGRFGTAIPVMIAFLNKWPTEVQVYPHWEVGESWRFILSIYLYWLASFALGRAVSFAKAGLEP